LTKDQEKLIAELLSMKPAEGNWVRDVSRNRWRVRISVDNKEQHIGRFKKLSEAIQARKDALYMYGYHPNHGK